MNPLAHLVPDTLEGRLVAVLTTSFLLLLGMVIALEIAARSTPMEWAESNATLNRVARMRTVLEHIDAPQRHSVLQSLSACHDGYALSASPYASLETNPRSNAVAAKIAQHIGIDPMAVVAGHARLSRDDFSYASCVDSQIDLPMNAVVISVRLQSGAWLHTEVHPHEWHLQDLLQRVLRLSVAFVLVGIVAIYFVRRLSVPLNNLTHAAQRFADGLKVSPVPEDGPQDLQRAIESFNAMQSQVVEEVAKRTQTLAAISHDLRTPLTALRIQAEFVHDHETRASLIAGVDKMEEIVASALEFLRGESRSEPLRQIDLSTMLECECSDAQDAGRRAEFVGEHGVQAQCRPEALARAVQNLIENANKYGDGATVRLRADHSHVEISVTDNGPGIPSEKFETAVAPFHRLSNARESHQGGFGLGLAIVQAIARGHDGELILRSNEPQGLEAVVRLPRATTSPTHSPESREAVSA